jgi:5-enolpyruvylshikimate-3-phosphate synthase
MKTPVTIDWTLVIAIYAALVATTAVLWDIYKWKTAGSNLDAHVATNMKVTGGPSRYGDDTLMILTISNRGDRATTITHLTMHRLCSD